MTTIVVHKLSKPLGLDGDIWAFVLNKEIHLTVIGVQLPICPTKMLANVRDR